MGDTATTLKTNYVKHIRTHIDIGMSFAIIDHPQSAITIFVRSQGLKNYTTRLHKFFLVAREIGDDLRGDMLTRTNHEQWFIPDFVYSSRNATQQRLTLSMKRSSVQSCHAMP